jgi:hypothetical protein
MMADDPEFEKRRRARNWAMLAALVSIAVLFFLITLVKLHRAP